jgi:cystathionine gamma-lyase
VWIESPTNPRLLVYDIAAIAAATHAPARLLVVDNTFASPLFQQPFQLGAGPRRAQRDEVPRRALRRDPGRRSWREGGAVFEPVKIPAERDRRRPRARSTAGSRLRGLKTLELRMQRHADNAEAIATPSTGIRS